ncbi:MAG: hypothetical protein R3232_12435, partial [Clostridia bacterium]|nr:hypothetical protein [Clostridia bacterium]
NELPSAMRNMYADADGNVWALPRGLTPVVMGRVFRADYLEELNLDAPDSLDSLYEVSKILADSDPDGNGMNDTFGMVYNNAGSFRDVFYANGVPVNVSNDGFQYTAISYNPYYESFEDSMLIEDMKATLEYIAKLNSEKILRKISGRSSSRVSDFEGNGSIANSYVPIPGYVYTDDKYTIVSGIRGKRAQNLNPLTYSFSDGFYVLGADTENPGSTIDSFVTLFFGDLEGYMFASRGIPGVKYRVNGNVVEVLDRAFFNYGLESLVKSNPLFSYETMDINMIVELGTGDILGDIIKRTTERDLYIENAKEQGIMYDISMEYAYPEVFTLKPGEIINSAAGTMFNSQFDRILTGRISVEDAMNKYIRDMKTLGMQEVIDELNANIGTKTKFKYD